MSEQLRIALAQFNPVVGDIAGNLEGIRTHLEAARDREGADLVVFPELALLGYPPEDLLLRPSLQPRLERALSRLAASVEGIDVLVGLPWREGERLYNTAVVIRDGEVLLRYCKRELPNYGVFDEKRYFHPGESAGLFRLKGVDVAVSVCEDIWYPRAMAQAHREGAALMLNINASPYYAGKSERRRVLVAERAREGAMPVVYANMVGGQDELVFDGGSMVMDDDGALALQAPQFESDLYTVDFDIEDGRCRARHQAPPTELSPEASVYRALVLGVRDYVGKNGFPGVVLGLSGGIDSALSLAVAVDALGAERVEAVMMPFRYTAQMSQDDAAQLAHNLGVDYRAISIEGIYDAFMDALAQEFAGRPRDATEENIQPRCRGVLLMGISNKSGRLVLTTGNKSEMAVGYATLYGDMAGGFGVLKDVAKTWVYRLARYRNAESPVIPERIIERPPSAELAPEQKDEDSLPSYPVLDAILEMYIEEEHSVEAISECGYEPELVRRVISMVDKNEYKRRQAPIGVRTSARAFGRDRRYPITFRWTSVE